MKSTYKKSPSYTRFQQGPLVLIKDDNLPPLRWATGRIVQTYLGKDGITLVADKVKSL